METSNNVLENPVKPNVAEKEQGDESDLGENVSQEIANKIEHVDEKLDKEKTVDDLKKDIEFYREQIKKGETKDENGNYNEALVLENENKLREAENKINEITKKEQDAVEIEKIRGDINVYRENIKKGENKNEFGKYDENLVLENEAKLREAENKINEITTGKKIETQEEPKKQTIKLEEVPMEEPKTKKKKKSFWKNLLKPGMWNGENR